MSILDSVLWDIEDYAGRAMDVVKLTTQVVVAVTRAFPWVVGILLICLSAFGFWLDSGSGSAPTIQQQILTHAKPGGTVYWALQSNGDKKQEADFSDAVRFCVAHKGFDGCQQVIKAANATPYGI
jgi:hypothetical protein